MEVFKEHIWRGNGLEGQRSSRTLQSQLCCPGKTTRVLTSDRLQRVTSGTGEAGHKRTGGDLESERKREGKKALFSMVFIKVCSLIVSVKVTGAFMSTWRVPTLVCKAKQ